MSRLKLQYAWKDFNSSFIYDHRCLMCHKQDSGFSTMAKITAGIQTFCNFYVDTHYNFVIKPSFRGGISHFLGDILVLKTDLKKRYYHVTFGCDMQSA